MGLTSQLLARGLPLLPRVLVGWVAQRYVAGEDLGAVAKAVRQLNSEGASATVALLGEDVGARQAALEAMEEYLRVLDLVAAERLDTNISVKLTLLGLRIDEGFCRENLQRLVEAAQKRQCFIRIDMEDHTCVDATLRLYGQLQEPPGHLGVVLQACLRRTLVDVDTLSAEANVRLCKGIYLEPVEIAWQDYATIRENFLQVLEKLWRRGAYVAVATHDEYLLAGALGMIDRLGVNSDRYEFQMLLGVAPALRRVLLAEGHRIRVYVPYGRNWYPYSVRRLRENPKIALYVLRALLGRR